MYSWTNLLLTLSVLFGITMIINNMLLILIVGLVLFLWNVYGYWRWLFDIIIEMDFLNISNSNHVEKKIRYILDLIKISKKDNVAELKIASII